MQMFGVGLPELMVVMVLAVLVIGPERLPGFAADLARWIRRARAYGQHLTRDFNDVIGELEKEAGASREDWKEIASVVTRHTSDVGREFTKLSTQIERASDIDGAVSTGNVVPIESARNGATTAPSTTDDHEQSRPLGESGESPADPTQPAEEEKPWYMPEQPTRRRSLD